MRLFYHTRRLNAVESLQTNAFKVVMCRSKGWRFVWAVGTQLFALERSSVKMNYSRKCQDPTTRWSTTQLQCVVCDFKPGREVTPNCGFDDDGGRHEPSTKKCAANTFNNGSSAYCQPCAVCPPGHEIVRPCSLTSNTQCQVSRNQTTEVSDKIQPTQGANLTSNATIEIANLPVHANPNVLILAVPLALLIFIMLVLSAFVIYKKQKRGQHTLSYNRRSSYINAGFSSLSAPPGNNDLEDILSSTTLSAPLQTVLDNLDVLEELIILLDPERHGVKNTKHLASLCSFPSTWITYAYSMKDCKSPLRAVLEVVTSRHPEWTVGHLVKLLRLMERNDAIAVLEKLRLKEFNV